MPKIKKMIPVMSILISFYFSVFLTLGVIIGYLGFDYLHKKAIKRGRASVFVKIGKGWEIHLHHWLVSAFLLFLIWVIGILEFLPKLILGIFFGVILHDIYLDDKWYKVFIKNKKGYFKKPLFYS